MFSSEVCLIVGDDGVREPKATYDILSKEYDYLLFYDM